MARSKEALLSAQRLAKVAEDATWRTVVVLSFLVSVTKSGPLGTMLPQSLWNTLQFGPIIAATIVLGLLPGRSQSRKSDRALLSSMAAFVIVALLSTFVSIAPGRTIAQVGLLALMTLFLVLTYARRWNRRSVLNIDLLTIYLAICVVQLSGLVALAVGAKWALGPYSRFTGLLSNANYAGMQSAVVLVLGCHLLTVWAGRRRALIAVGMAALLIALILSGSRGSMIAVVVGVALFLVLTRKWRSLAAGLTVLTVGAGILAFFFPEVLSRVQAGDPTSGRVGIYESMVGNWLTSPFLGTGFRTTELLPGTNGLAGHNIFLSVLTETGIIGLLAFLAVLAAVVFSGRQGTMAGAAAAVIVVELTESSIYGWGGPTALVSWLVLLSFAALRHLPAPKTPESLYQDLSAN